MRIILPIWIYKYFLKYESYPKYILFNIAKNLKLNPYMMSNSFLDLIKYIKE